MVRRRIAAVVVVVILIVLIVLIAGVVGGHNEEALVRYNRDVGRLMGESDQQVGKPLFAALGAAQSHSALQVEHEVDQLRERAQAQARRAERLSTPASMQAAQRALILAMTLRAEGLTKIASLVGTVLGSGDAEQASRFMAGAMETFLASEVVYSQRVVPLIHQTLAANGVRGQTTPGTRFLSDVGWLTPATLMTRLTGRAPASSKGALAPGTHGSALTGVSVGASTLSTAATLNHVRSGANPTFVAMVENSGENPETNVKVSVEVEVAGKQIKASRTIGETIPGKTVGAEITVKDVPLDAPARVSVHVAAVPGETDLANNSATYLAVFEK